MPDPIPYHELNQILLALGESGPLADIGEYCPWTRAEIEELALQRLM